MFAHSGSKSGADMEGSSFAADGKVAALDAVATNALGEAYTFATCNFAVATMGFSSPHGSCITPALTSDLAVGGGGGRHRGRVFSAFTGGSTA